MNEWLFKEEWLKKANRIALENEQNRKEKMSDYYSKRRDFYTYGYEGMSRTRINPFAVVDPDSPYKIDDRYGALTLQEEMERRERLKESTQVQLDAHFFKVDIPKLNQNN